jgi:hypothetical protein
MERGGILFFCCLFVICLFVEIFFQRVFSVLFASPGFVVTSCGGLSVVVSRWIPMRVSAEKTYQVWGSIPIATAVRRHGFSEEV